MYLYIKLKTYRFYKTIQNNKISYTPEWLQLVGTGNIIKGEEYNLHAAIICKKFIEAATFQSCSHCQACVLFIIALITQQCDSVVIIIVDKKQRSSEPFHGQSHWKGYSSSLQVWWPLTWVFFPRCSWLVIYSLQKLLINS